jgi:hypothetical protein
MAGAGHRIGNAHNSPMGRNPGMLSPEIAQRGGETVARHRRPWARAASRAAAAPVPNAAPAARERAAGAIAGELPPLGRRDSEAHQVLHTRRG